MRTHLALVCILVTIGCSSSPDTTATDASSNALIGTWLSNCHEFLGTENEAGNNRYNISRIVFTEAEYVDNYVSYTDINCTVDPVEEANDFSYTVGDMITTTDGVEATRITLTARIPDRPDLEVLFEAIYRISGVDLNFGKYTEGEIPSIDVGVTYTKQ